MKYLIANQWYAILFVAFLVLLGLLCALLVWLTPRDKKKSATRGGYTSTAIYLQPKHHVPKANTPVDTYAPFAVFRNMDESEGSSDENESEKK